LNSARSALEAASLPAVRAGDVNTANELALRQQSRSQTGPRRMLSLSDFARHNVFDLHQLPNDEGYLSAERVGPIPDRANLFIAEAHASQDPTRPRETSIAFELHATHTPLQNTPQQVRVEAELDGKPVRSVQVDLQRDSAKATLYVPTPELDSNLVGKLRLHIAANDALEADDDYWLSLGHADAVRVLLVNGDPRPESRSDELYYVTRALALVPEQLLALRVWSVDPLSFEHTDLTAQDVVVLANAPAPSDALSTRLLEFVRRGGGLIVAGGARVDAARYNAQFGNLLASHIRALGTADHVHFAAGNVPQFLPEGLSGLREVQTTQRLLLEPGPVDTLLTFDDGLPALTARSEGDGRSLLLATSLDTQFSDLPLRPGFLPLLAAMIREAAGPAATRTHVSAGESVTLPAVRRGGYDEVRSPDGRRQRFTFTDAAEPVRFTASDSLGIYEVRSGHGSADDGRVRGSFVVNPVREESDLTPGPVPQLSAAGHSKPTRTSVHRSLAAFCLCALFSLVALEGVLRLRRSAFIARSDTARARPPANAAGASP
jgi:hypothetical protein